MGQLSPEFAGALDGLREAAKAALAGNAYYMVSNEINELIELIKPDNGIAATKRAAVDFDVALADLRRSAEQELSGNQFYLASNRLDSLAFHLPALLGAWETERAGAGGHERGRTFDDLSAAAKSRVDYVAASLGIIAGRPTPPWHTAAPGRLADGELERRSSEPCFMGEPIPPAMETMARPSVLPKAAAAFDKGKTAPDLGSSAAEVERSFGPGSNPAHAPEETRAKPAAHPAAAAHDSTPAAAGQKIESAKKTGSRPKGQKTLFNLWLDMLFGRKD